tara:strand:- start:5342 stop:6454 length:1113 start_codon:yes stop_codon:yes gene_type:complete
MLPAGLKLLLAKVETQLLSYDTELVETPIVQHAEPFLNMAGEDLRRRIFLTQSISGETKCLRPEFTIPVCSQHILDHENTPKRYAYLGQVFRQRRDGPTEFFQAGIEDLGHEDLANADATAIANAIGLVSECAVNQNVQVTMGDQAIFAAVLDALGLPKGWQARLLNAFGDQSSLDEMLLKLAKPEEQVALDGELNDIIKSENKDHLAEHLTKLMKATGYSTNASRSPADIAHRVVEKRRLSQVSLSENELAILREFLSIKISLDSAVAKLEAFASHSGLAIEPSLKSFSERISQLVAMDIDISTIGYGAAFGRPLDYYTGLVFEIIDTDTQEVLAGGGRYDRLMELLGAGKTIPAVGFSLWLDRFEVTK